MLYSIILTIHIITALCLLATVLFSDFKALLWMRGKVETLPHKLLVRLHHVVYGGLVVMLATGLYMFWPVQSYLLTQPAFQLKMLFVFLLLINSIFIGKHLRLASTNSFTDLTSKQQFTLFFSGAVSFTAWVGALIAATQLGL